MSIQSKLEYTRLNKWKHDDYDDGDDGEDSDEGGRMAESKFGWSHTNLPSCHFVSS